MILGLLQGLELRRLIDPVTDVLGLVDIYLEVSVERWQLDLVDLSAS